MRQEKQRPAALGALMFCGLLAPMFRIAPGSGAAPAQAGGWLSPLLALPLFLVPVWVLVRVCRVLPEGPGLGRLYPLAFGRALGRAALLVTGLWAVLAAGMGLRYYSESIISTVYQDTSMWIFLLGLMAVVWRAGGLGMGVLCRVAKAYLIIIGVILLSVGLLALGEIRLYNLWPCWTAGWRGLLPTVLPVLGIEAPVMLILFRRTDAAGTLEGGRTLSLWAGAVSLTMAAVRAVVIGMFGWETAVRLQTPLYSAAKEVYLLEVFERMEALVVAVWALSDIVWIAALLIAAWDYTGQALRLSGNPVLLALLTLGILVFAGSGGGDLYRVRSSLLALGQWVNLAVCYALPLSAWAAATLRGKI